MSSLTTQTGKCSDNKAHNKKCKNYRKKTKNNRIIAAGEASNKYKSKMQKHL